MKHGISVLMSVYIKENPNFFREALESIINQTRQPDEIVIIKDGALSPALEEVIESAKTRFEHIVTYQFEENVLLGRALRKGVELCKYEFVARMDTDDIAVPERLAIQYAFLSENDEIAVCGGNIEEIDLSGQHIDYKEMPCTEPEISNYMKYRNPLNHMTVMLRKDMILKAGNYRHYPYLEDYDLWCRVVAEGGNIINIPEILVKVRTSTALYKRRGGLEYCKRYLKLRNEQLRLSILNRGEWVKAIAITLAITLVPASVRQMVYVKVLRK